MCDRQIEIEILKRALQIYCFLFITDYIPPRCFCTLCQNLVGYILRCFLVACFPPNSIAIPLRFPPNLLFTPPEAAGPLSGCSGVTWTEQSISATAGLQISTKRANFETCLLSFLPFYYHRTAERKSTPRHNHNHWQIVARSSQCCQSLANLKLLRLSNDCNESLFTIACSNCAFVCRSERIRVSLFLTDRP